MIVGWVEQWWVSDLTSNDFVVQNGLPISGRALRGHGERHFKEVLIELHQLRAGWRQSPSSEKPLTAGLSAVALVPVAEPTNQTPTVPSRQVASDDGCSPETDSFFLNWDLE
ncbi:MAG: hypothetical protein Q8K32_07235 [Archangium sp.]|nr:hypothetical protein [Archangium sp.]